MAYDIKALKTRIKSVDSTFHLTKAMGLVASSKVRRATEAMSNAASFASSLDETIRALSSCRSCQNSLYMRSGGDRVKMIVIAGDRGLAGGYNNNVFRTAREYPDAIIVPIGKRACDKFGGGYVSCEKFSSADADDLTERLLSEFAAGEFDRLAILSTEYVTMMKQEPHVSWVLPIEKTEGASSGTIFEPNEEEVFPWAVRLYVAGVIMASVRESFASEVAARRVAMDAAGKNAKKMIDDLTIRYNRARQGAITQEITEIVAGAGRS